MTNVDLLISTKSSPHGCYNHATWELFSNGNFVSDEAHIVSIHESMHHLLNNTTLFGSLLMLVAHLAQECKEFKFLLGELLNNSRTSHEIFATYSSLLLVFPDSAHKSWVKKHYRTPYVQLFEEASKLVEGTTFPHLKFPALFSICSICFQSRHIATAILNDTLFNLHYHAFPDTRLRVIQEKITPEFWRKLDKEYIRDAFHNDAIALEFMAEKGYETLVQKYGLEILIKAELKYSTFVYKKINADILKSKYDSLAQDDYLSYLPQLLTCVENIAPKQMFSKPFFEETISEFDFGLSEFENESIHIREYPLAAKIIAFSELNPIEWDTLCFNFEQLKHFYIISRMTKKLIEQFCFEDHEKTFLLETYPDFVVSLISKQSVDAQVTLLIIILDEPEQFIQLSHHALFIISNSSLFLLAEKQWQKWREVLQRYSIHTILFDRSPSKYIECIINQYDRVEYVKIHLIMDDKIYPCVCLIARKVSNRSIFLIPCSEVLANILIKFISINENNSHCKKYNKNLSVLNLFIRYSLIHLFDETIFNFRSLNTQYKI